MPHDPGYRPSSGVLPAAWPSAWPSMRRNVLRGVALPLAATVVVLAVLALTRTLSISWWFALIPLVLLAWPLSLPARVRAVVQDAARARTLDVVQGTVGLIAEVRHRRLGVRPNAELVPGRPVRYYLNRGKRSRRAT